MHGMCRTFRRSAMCGRVSCQLHHQRSAACGDAGTVAKEIPAFDREKLLIIVLPLFFRFLLPCSEVFPFLIRGVVPAVLLDTHD